MNGTASHAHQETGNLVVLTPIKSVRLGNFAMKVLFILSILPPEVASGARWSTREPDIENPPYSEESGGFDILVAGAGLEPATFGL